MCVCFIHPDSDFCAVCVNVCACVYLCTCARSTDNLSRVCPTSRPVHAGIPDRQEPEQDQRFRGTGLKCGCLQLQQAGCAHEQDRCFLFSDSQLIIKVMNNPTDKDASSLV